jgi:hypothetical protein
MDQAVKYEHGDPIRSGLSGNSFAKKPGMPQLRKEFFLNNPTILLGLLGKFATSGMRSHGKENRFVGQRNVRCNRYLPYYSTGA